jgi:antitoxin MazE
MEEAAMQVSKWGDSLAVRLPEALVEKMGLRVGDELNIIDVAERTLVVQKEDRRRLAFENPRARCGERAKIDLTDPGCVKTCTSQGCAELFSLSS